MILQTSTFWRDQNNLEVAISFNRYQCRVQNGTDDSMITFSVSGIEDAAIVKESLTKITTQLQEYINVN